MQLLHSRACLQEPTPTPPLGFESLARQLAELQDSVNALPDKLCLLLNSSNQQKQRRQSSDSSGSDDETWQPSGGVLSLLLSKCIEEEQVRPGPDSSRRVSLMSGASSMASRANNKSSRVNSIVSNMSIDSSIFSSGLRSGPLLGSQAPMIGGGRRRMPSSTRENGVMANNIDSRTNSMCSINAIGRSSLVSNGVERRKNTVVSQGGEWRNNRVASGMGVGMASIDDTAGQRSSILDHSNDSNDDMEQKGKQGGGSGNKMTMHKGSPMSSASGSGGPSAVLPALTETEEAWSSPKPKTSKKSEVQEAVWSLRLTQTRSLRAMDSVRRLNSCCVEDDECPFEESTQSSLSTWLLVLDPESALCFLWNSIMVVDLIFLAVLLPVQVAYLEAALPPIWAGLLQLSDALLIADVLWNLIVPWNAGMELLVHPLDILFQYAQSWLLLDLVAAVPLLDAAGPVTNASGVLLRVMKVVKCWKLTRYLPRVQAFLSSTFLAYMKIFLPLLLVFHLFACVWRCILRAEGAENFQLGEQDLERSYVDDLYWLVMTMTSVGYGDIANTSTYGRVYAIFTMFASSFYTGFTVSSTSTALKKLFDDRVESQVNETNRFLIRHHMPSGLRHRIEYHLRNKKARVSETQHLLQLLSPSLRKELSRDLLSNLLKGFPMFRESPESVVAQLAQAHTWVHAAAGELVVEEGKVEQELMFVWSGKLLMLRVDSFIGNLDEVALGPKSWFGERCLFLQNATRQCTVLAEEDAELAYLHITEFHRVLALFPEIQKQHLKLTDQVEKGELNLRDLQYVTPEMESEQQGPSLNCCLRTLLRPLYSV